MKKAKCCDFLGEWGKYTICNVFDNDALSGPCSECYSNPSIHLSYISLSNHKNPINDSLLKYCVFLTVYEGNDGDESKYCCTRKHEYTFLKQNLVAILREDFLDWKLIGVEIDPYTTFICIVNIKTSNVYYVMLKARLRKLELLFEVERNDANITQFYYSLQRSLGFMPKTTVIIRSCSSKFSKIVFSVARCKIYEWLTGLDRRPISIFKYGSP